MSERRVTFTNLDNAHDVGPFGSNAAQLYVKDGKLWAQLQGETVVEIEDLGQSVTYPVGSYTAADITVDNKGRVTAAASGASNPAARITSFAATGSAQTWTAPSGVTRAKFTIVGGGGKAYSTGGNSPTAGGGGGGGGLCIATVTVSSGTGYTVSVGAGGTVSSNGTNNIPYAGTSSVVVGAATYSASGAGGGYPTNNNVMVGGPGGTGTNGDVNLTGESGVTAGNYSHIGGVAPLVSLYGKGGTQTGSSEENGDDGIVLVEWME